MCVQECVFMYLRKFTIVVYYFLCVIDILSALLGFMTDSLLSFLLESCYLNFYPQPFLISTSLCVVLSDLCYCRIRAITLTTVSLHSKYSILGSSCLEFPCFFTNSFKIRLSAKLAHMMKLHGY